MAYVLNVRENYGLTEGEIGESRSALALKGNPCSARDILERAFQQKVSIYTMAGEWSKLRNLYYVMANFHLRAEAGIRRSPACSLSSSWICRGWGIEIPSFLMKTYFLPKRE